MERTTASSNTTWERTFGYSRLVKVGPFIYVSGTTATNEQGQIVGIGDAYAQSMQIWKNIEKALSKVGASLAHVVRTRMFVVDIEKHSDAVGKAHGVAFASIRPASTMIGISELLVPEMLVEFEVDAIMESESKIKG